MPVPLGDSISAFGCCRMDGRCGLDAPGFGCVTPENMEAVWGPGVPFTEAACTF